MRGIVNFINNATEFRTIMCCCGHGKYPPSLIITNPCPSEFCKIQEKPFEIFSNYIFRKGQKRFYKKDKQGYYYLPEVLNG